MPETAIEVSEPGCETTEEDGEEPAIDPVVQAVDERIRQGALRQLEELDLDDFDARLPPLSALANGMAATEKEE